MVTWGYKVKLVPRPDQLELIPCPLKLLDSPLGHNSRGFLSFGEEKYPYECTDRYVEVSRRRFLGIWSVIFTHIMRTILLPLSSQRTLVNL